MVNKERQPNDDIDLYTNPRLSPNPAWHPELLATRVALKRERIRASVQAFGRHQSEAARRREAAKKKEDEERRLAQEAAKAKQNRKLSYEDNPDGYGFLPDKGGRPIRVDHTVENDHLFRYDPDRGFLVSYHGSADVVSFLETQTPLRSIDSIESVDPGNDQRLAFFDTKGIFYNDVLLLDFRENPDAPGNITKHDAVFAVPTEGTYQELPIAIDDIYCISEAAGP